MDSTTIAGIEGAINLTIGDVWTIAGLIILAIASLFALALIANFLRKGGGVSVGNVSFYRHRRFNAVRSYRYSRRY